MKKYIQKNDKKSYSDHWSTPLNIYNDFMDRGFYDPCPLYGDDFDFTTINKPLFINPPYSDIKPWVDFAIRNHKEFKKDVVFLVPSRTDTKWFHELLDYGVDFNFIKGRLKFGNAKNSAPFPSVLIKLKGSGKNEKD